MNFEGMAHQRQTTARRDPTESSHGGNGSTIDTKEGIARPLHTDSSNSQRAASSREDIKALALGVAISFLLTLAMKLLEYRLLEVPHEPDKGVLIYYWVLPNPTVTTRLSAWGLYLCHQFAHWGVVYYAQTRINKTTTALHAVNYVAFAVNLFFSVLHLVQTHVFYDGLAQDTHEISPQVSVIIMLIWVLLMENFNRGMIVGYPLPLSEELVRFARKYHGYYFSWAIIYTFWYHPMETTPGHLAGFLYTFLLLVQGSLFFTKVHLNSWWNLFLEVLVAPHAVLVAIYQTPANLWPMFLFGFLGVFVLTQVYTPVFGLRAKVLCTVVFIVSCVAVYGNEPLSKANEPIRIPIIDYLGVLILSGVLLVIMKLGKCFGWEWTPSTSQLRAELCIAS